MLSIFSCNMLFVQSAFFYSILQPLPFIGIIIPHYWGKTLWVLYLGLHICEVFQSSWWNRGYFDLDSHILLQLVLSNGFFPQLKSVGFSPKLINIPLNTCKNLLADQSFFVYISHFQISGPWTWADLVTLNSVIFLQFRESTVFYASSPTLDYNLEISSRLQHQSGVHLICFLSVTVPPCLVLSAFKTVSSVLSSVSGGKVILVHTDIYNLRNLWLKWW